MKKKFFILLATTLTLSSPLTALAACQHNNDPWNVEYDADCEDEGLEIRYCSVCQEYQKRLITKNGFIFLVNGKYLKKATKFSKGEALRYCINCGEEEYKTIPKKKMTKAEKNVKKVIDTFLLCCQKV